MPTEDNLLLYQSKDGVVKFHVKIQGETVWLSQKQMAELFDCSIDNISLHLKKIYNEAELSEDSVTEDYSITAADGKMYRVVHYNLDAIISVGYRINSRRGTDFRIWATQRLREYIIKGFVLDDERLRQGRAGTRYFEELVERIRDIRASERNFYQKVTDIFATSVDYRPDAGVTKDFFATVQNKLHYAVHGHTAAELIAARADASKPLMGMTNLKGDYVTAADARVAKNYLTVAELKQLNLVVSLYLDFAELQASNGRTMRMTDWLDKFDGFLRLSEREVLPNAGSISADLAEQKAMEQYDDYRQAREAGLVSDFDQQAKDLLELLKRTDRE